MKAASIDTHRRFDGETRDRAKGVTLALGTAVISGVAVFMNSYGVKRFASPSVYTTAKNLVATVVLIAFAAALAASRSSDRPARPETRTQWLGLLVVAVIGGSVPFLLFFEGLSQATSTHAAFIHKTLIVWVALLALPLLKERLGPLHVAAIAVLLIGQARLEDGVGSIAGRGEAMILAATLLWSLEVVLAKRLLRDLSSATVGVARMGFGSVVLVGWVVVTGRLHQLAITDAEPWGWALLTGVILAAYVATWFAALARAQAVDVTAVLVFGAVVTALLTAVAEGDALGPKAIALGLITAGTTLTIGATRRASRVPRPRQA
jgi:drug/metabolite transporter (DMT)-like permease